MRLILILFCSFFLSSCWTKVRPVNYAKVWGSKPIYGSFPEAKIISYSGIAVPVIIPGNIYTKGNIIYQIELGKGIHVIDNSVPALAQRVGFITVNGSSQISIKGNLLYTNNYDDLVVVDISNSNAVTVVKRVVGAFPEGRLIYYNSRPAVAGYYECPRYDSAVVGWRLDSISASSCFKN